MEGRQLTTQFIIPSYLYAEYADDPSCQAFVNAYNQYAQAYLDAFNALTLPVYPNGSISGSLLDWTALYIYGFLRPGLPTTGAPQIGPYNTFAYNTLAFDGSKLPTGQTYYSTSDDVFKRCMTWALYKGDGKQFNVAWLKRRVARFLGCPNGLPLNIDQTYGVSVVMAAGVCTITVPSSPIAVIFEQAVKAGVLELPFQYTYIIDLAVGSGFGDFAFGESAFGYV